jgi:glycosyltransferase involved in cell wall biosynthesis
VVTTSEDFRAAVVRHPAYRNIPSDVVNEKVVLIPNCTDMNRFQPDPLSRNRLRLEWGLQESVVFLWLVGAVKKWHMPREVAEFYKAARRVIRNAHLVVLTRDGKAKEALDQVGVPGDGYTIYSPVPEEVAKYIVIGDIGISFLVREAGHSAAVKSAEYLACGLPVVVSAGQSGFDELVQANDIGVVVKQYSEGEYEDVAREIVKLLRDRTMLEQRSRAVAMQTFSLPRAVELYDKVYSEVLRGGRRRVVEH